MKLVDQFEMILTRLAKKEKTKASSTKKEEFNDSF